MEPFAVFIGDGSRVFREKIRMGMQEIVNDMLHPIALYGEISSCTISLQVSDFLLPRKFLQTFWNNFQALLSVEVNAVLKVLVFEQFCNVWTNENSFFQLGLPYFGK